MTLNYSNRSASGSAVGGASDVTQAELTALEAAYLAADTAINASISSKADQTALAQEGVDRTAADTTLQTNIDAEEAARIAADNLLAASVGDKADLTALLAETTARTNADTTLTAEIATVRTALEGIGERVQLPTLAAMAADTTSPNGTTFRVIDAGGGKWALYERIGGADVLYLSQDDLAAAIAALTLAQASATTGPDSAISGSITGAVLNQVIAAYDFATAADLTAEAAALQTNIDAKIDASSLNNVTEFSADTVLGLADVATYLPDVMYFGRNTSANTIEFGADVGYRGAAPVQSKLAVTSDRVTILAGENFFWYFKAGVTFRVEPLVPRFSERSIYLEQSSPSGSTGTANQWHPLNVDATDQLLINNDMVQVTGEGEFLFVEPGIYRTQITFEIGNGSDTGHRLIFGYRTAALSDPELSTLWRGITNRFGTDPMYFDPSGDVRITAANTTRVLAFFYSGPSMTIGLTKVTITKIN